MLLSDDAVTQNSASQLNYNGFRRSGDHIYRPHCSHCNACESARVAVELFKPNRAAKRCIKANRMLRVEFHTPYDSDAFYPLYERYISHRHREGDMYPPSLDTFDNFLGPIFPFTHYLGVFDGATLIGVMVYDRFVDGLSAVYSFFDPSYEGTSMGRFLILQLLELTKRFELPFLYLGYAVDDCDKMQYKAQYQPQERFVDGLWQPRTK